MRPTHQHGPQRHASAMRVRRAALALWTALAVSVRAPAAEPPRTAPPVPPVLPPVPRSPVEVFRELLAASPAQREAYLASRAPAARRTIEAKLKEFEPLTPNQRELRLQLAQLHFYLTPLLRKDPANRDTEAELSRIPGALRSVIRDRLRTWDQLAPDSRRFLLENEQALVRFAQIEKVATTNSPPPPSTFSASAQSTPSATADPSFDRWRSLPSDARQKAITDFNRLFQLSAPEQERALRTLSESERREMEISLKRFAALPPETREECVRSFPKFADLSADQRSEFLKSVARWQLLSPDERDAWRRLVRVLPPLPPIPPPPSSRATLFATNAAVAPASTPPETRNAPPP